MPNPSNLPPVSIVIPNFNGETLLNANLPLVLAALDHYGSGGEIIVVDDGSSDASVDCLKRQHPRVRCIVHENNRGFSEAIKSGVSNSAYEHLILLNSDVIPDLDFIEPLLRRLNDDVFAVTPQILDQHRQPLSYSCNIKRLHKGRLKNIKLDLDALIARGEACKHLYPSGGSAAIHKARFAELNYFDEIFKPFYYEDVDLGIRAWRRGWKVLFEPASRVVHPTGSTIRRYHKPKRVKRIFYRNEILLYWSHFSLTTILTQQLPWLLLRLLRDLLRLDDVKVGATLSAFSYLPRVVRTRRQAPRWHKGSLEQLLQQISQVEAPPQPESAK